MSKKTLSNALKATGLAVLVGVASGCVPTYSLYTFDQYERDKREREREGVIFDTTRNTYILPQVRGPPRGPPYEGAKGFWLGADKSDPFYVWQSAK